MGGEGKGGDRKGGKGRKGKGRERNGKGMERKGEEGRPPVNFGWLRASVDFIFCFKSVLHFVNVCLHQD